ncbi:MAG: hypothetical protein M1838_002529 [Thelocarpon superellum]|nr:MAG: hypothetical protein M1838_002529 [Thelocarpon superellum]
MGPSTGPPPKGKDSPGGRDRMKPKTPKKAGKGRDKATMDDSPREGLPYFSQDVLDPDVYPTALGKPCGGPSPLPRVREDDSEDDARPTDKLQLDVTGPGQAEPAKYAPPASTLTVETTPTSSVATPKTGKKHHLSSSMAFSGVKKPKIAGGRAAVPKKVHWDMDSDDELLVKMKEGHYTDAEIADHLQKTGRVKYSRKTISSRYTRLRKAIDDHEEQRLDLGETVWHGGDDERLLSAIEEAETTMEREKNKIDSRRWDYVAKHLMASKPQGNYSAGACKKRSEALWAGTAQIPPELDDKHEEEGEAAAALAAKTMNTNIDESSPSSAREHASFEVGNASDHAEIGAMSGNESAIVSPRRHHQNFSPDGLFVPQEQDQDMDVCIKVDEDSDDPHDNSSLFADHHSAHVASPSPAHYTPVAPSSAAATVLLSRRVNLQW